MVTPEAKQTQLDRLPLNECCVKVLTALQKAAYAEGKAEAYGIVRRWIEAKLVEEQGEQGDGK
jgi:hypothetical protein